MKKIKLLMKKNFPRLSTTILYFFYFLRHFLVFQRKPVRSSAIIKALKRDGCYVLENYYSQDECQVFRNAIRFFFRNHPEYVHKGSDCRVFGIEHASEDIVRFHRDSFLFDIAQYCFRTSIKNGFTLAGILESGSKGSSGEEWHRDSFFCQMKALVYLTDCSEKNGPFQLLKGSHKLRNILKHMKKANLSCMQTRLSDDNLTDILNDDPLKLKTFSAKQGTVIIFDSSAVHRGMPIMEGERISLTNYYFPIDRIGDQLYDYFSPVYRSRK